MDPQLAAEGLQVEGLLHQVHETQLTEWLEKSYFGLRNFLNPSDEVKEVCKRAKEKYRKCGTDAECPAGCMDPRTLKAGKTPTPMKMTPDHTDRHFHLPSQSALAYSDGGETSGTNGSSDDPFNKTKTFLVPCASDPSKGWFVSFCIRQGCRAQHGSKKSKKRGSKQCDKEGKHYHCPRCQGICGRPKVMGDHIQKKCPQLHAHQPGHPEEQSEEGQPSPMPFSSLEDDLPFALENQSADNAPSQRRVMLPVMKVDEKNGVYAVFHPRGRHSATHVLTQQGPLEYDDSYAGNERLLICPACLDAGHQEETLKCDHVVAVESAWKDPSRFVPAGKEMPIPDPHNFARGYKSARVKYNKLHKYATGQLLGAESMTPLIVELTTSKSLSYRKFSVLKSPDSLDRVVVHAATPNAVRCKENFQNQCSNSSSLPAVRKNDEGEKCKPDMCVHIHLVQESMDFGEEDQSEHAAEHAYARPYASLRQEAIPALDFNLVTTAQVLLLQRKKFQHYPWQYKKFWPENDIGEADFPLEDSLMYPEWTCLRPSCGKQLVEFGTRVVWVVGLTKAFERRVVEKVCTGEDCRALHSWFGWKAGAHNIGNQVIVSLRVVHQCQGALRYAQTPIGKAIGVIARGLKDWGHFGVAHQMEYVYDQVIRQGILQFLSLAWTPWEKRKVHHCPICKSHPDIIVIDGMQKIVLDERGGELADDGDPLSSYELAVLEQIWLMKQDFVNVRPFYGGRHFPGLQTSGRGLSGPFALYPAEKIQDRESQKGSGGEPPSRSLLKTRARAKKRVPVTDSQLDTDEDPEEVMMKQFESPQSSEISDVSLEEFALNYSKLTKVQLKERMEKIGLTILPGVKTLKALRESALDQLKARNYSVNHLAENTRSKSGGVLLAICPHGIIYLFKCLRKTETPGDHVDALMSLLNIPYVYVGDLAPMVGLNYAELKKDSIMSSRRGAVHDRVDSNVDLLEEGMLEKRSLLKEVERLGLQGDARDLLFCLLDRFHERNHTSNFACLHKADLVLEMKGKNTQVCEQRNAVLYDLAAALTQWVPHAGQVLLAILTCMWNQETAEKLKAKNVRKKRRTHKVPIGEGPVPDERLKACDLSVGSSPALSREDLPIANDTPRWRLGKRKMPEPLEERPKTVVLSAFRPELPREADELRLMHEVMPDFKRYLDREVASVGPATFYDRPIPVNGRVVDHNHGQLEVLITNVKAKSNQNCRGCFGAISLRNLATPAMPSPYLKAPGHPLSLMFVVEDGYAERWINPKRIKRQEGVRMLFHFRPKCLRLAFPKANVIFHVLKDVKRLFPGHLRIMDFIEKMQEIPDCAADGLG